MYSLPDPMILNKMGTVLLNLYGAQQSISEGLSKACNWTIMTKKAFS